MTWVRIAGGPFRLGLEDDEAEALAEQLAERARTELAGSPDPLHGLWQEAQATRGPEHWLALLAMARPAHEVVLAPFEILQHPVTEGDYAAFMRATGAAPPERRAGVRGALDPRLPVTGVSWQDAVAYATWFGAALPSEAQWERAARGPGHALFPWGDRYGERGAWLDQQTGPWRTGSHPELASDEGVHDLVTRLFEWCADLFQQYPGADTEGWQRLTPADGFGGTRARRSGEPGELMPSAVGRRGADPSLRLRDTTFRCVREVRE